MTISPAEWLNFAKTQIGVQSEAAWRSAASRAYYGAYHATRPIAEPLAGNDAGGSHERLIKALTGCRVIDVGSQRASALRTLGYLLNQARASRIAADYRVNDSFTQRQATNAITEAENVLAHLAANAALFS